MKLLELESFEFWRKPRVTYRRDRALSVASKTLGSGMRQLSDHLNKTDPFAHR
jgi:hypothetical protein